MARLNRADFEGYKGQRVAISLVSWRKVLARAFTKTASKKLVGWLRELVMRSSFLRQQNSLF
ncbi:hypothetical protein [Nodosilinea sp. LEGE 06152]|uniref:hypothetical protein n=1 Tax=Nodosilinea sp. LEGE 06152 TaxID=2777966 RepID=UPI00187F0EA1|nr:hypothetical protein [Nodosilinea sp. LEGE 06152]